jgi:hypothetical protein
LFTFYFYLVYFLSLPANLKKLLIRSKQANFGSIVGLSKKPEITSGKGGENAKCKMQNAK